MCERRHTKGTTRRQEGRRTETGGRRKGERQEGKDREEGVAERRGRRGNAASKGAGQRRQARQQEDKGEVEKTETQAGKGFRQLRFPTNGSNTR